ncbi:MAG: type I-E CRISPR-associated protein Cse1/CasA [Thermodesulfobacteriota bacterium]|nr:type I-E CRISPR-associated protein Cse1/CasA [Thermodesulfobacteriota bacterium]
MNLLKDRWIPVQIGTNDVQLIKLRQLLCQEEQWQICLNRDDMELAALQLLVCLVQVIFMPENKREFISRWQKPLTEEEYEKGVQPFLDWFDLLHPKYPFMQIRGVKAAKLTPIQKLFIGLPEGNNHAFFNRPDEYKQASLANAAILLFNQAMNSPSFGGGFKGGLRGGAPVTTLIVDDSLRQTIWCNILSKEFASSLFPKIENDVPVWVYPIKPKEQMFTSELGFVRGIFWQPAHIELVCDDEGVVVGFNKEKFPFTIQDELAVRWPHPHGVKKWAVKKGEREEKFLSFTTQAPAWTSLASLLVEQHGEKMGNSPALVLSQYGHVFRGRPLHLAVGGYRNKQALILERRHEMFSFKKGWPEGLGHVKLIIDYALECKTILRKKMYGLNKNIGLKGLDNKSEAMFFKRSESLIHHVLQDIDWQQAIEEVKEAYLQLTQMTKQIFEDLVAPYDYDPKMMKVIVKSRAALANDLYKMEG